MSLNIKNPPRVVLLKNSCKTLPKSSEVISNVPKQINKLPQLLPKSIKEQQSEHLKQLIQETKPKLDIIG